MGSDEVCVYHALWSYLTPRFTSTDLALSEAQLRVIFPTCEPFTASEYLAGLPRPLREAIQAPGTTEAVQHKLAQVVTAGDNARTVKLRCTAWHTGGVRWAQRSVND